MPALGADQRTARPPPGAAHRVDQDPGVIPIDPVLVKTLDPGELLHEQLSRAPPELVRELLATFISSLPGCRGRRGVAAPRLDRALPRGLCSWTCYLVGVPRELGQGPPWSAVGSTARRVGAVLAEH